jgi:3-methyladenine DNA glycosylase AlkD
MNVNTVDEVMIELKKLGSEQTRKTYARHGGPVDRMFGVKVGDMKIIHKKIKGNQPLAMELYATGNSDAQYLAGLVADGAKMSKKEIETWAKTAVWSMISDFTVPWVASESKHGHELAMKWIKSKEVATAVMGWATYSSIISTRPDEELDLGEIDALLTKATKEVHKAPDKVAYAMNSFIICVGSYVKPLLAKAKAAAKAVGVVSVDMGDTACKVPVATEYIAKVEAMKRVGQKRKTAKC